jgi:L,D-peptidoglycan transpeptidase YkuD (ErfK/YbiS/YcfS/YnhG family)
MRSATLRRPVQAAVSALTALTMLTVVGCSSGSTAGRPSTLRASSPRSTAVSTSASPAAAPTVVGRPTTSPPTHRPHTSASPSHSPSPSRPASTPSPASQPGPHKLPLRFSTGDATEVITVVASSTSDTTARLQAWRKVVGGWRHVGAATTAWLGSNGLTDHPSEGRSSTPIGTFTLTQAFGHRANPGTGLPYLRTTPGDWWISQTGPLYNTHQRCSSGCEFTRGAPNEHLYYETPYYNYAVVIDYNTRNAPGGVRQGAGSAFFLHVTDHKPTAGCVAIDEQKLTTLMRWLRPSAHPRILIGTS